MHFVYILYSSSIDRYYVGETHDISLRIKRHNEGYYENKWTKKGIPWSLFHAINCENVIQAKSSESHIKRMKSRNYLENLVKYPEMAEKLRTKFPPELDC